MAASGDHALFESGGHFIIAGYGLPGRAVAEALDHLHLPYCALELNPAMKIISRTHYLSSGIEAKARGADAVIVAEQVVAVEMSRVVAEIFSRGGITSRLTS